MPADGDTFAWRVSVAHIDASGPFSEFAAYRRTMVLLEGDGVELESADGGRRSLRRIGDLAEFDGALATHCTLLGGPCVDLNLMVAKPCEATVGVRRLTGARECLSAVASAAESTLIFSIDEALAITSESGPTLNLEPWDLGVFRNDSMHVRRRHAGACEKTGAVFFATIRH